MLARSLTAMCLAALFAVSLLGTTAHAQNRETPYWATLRFDEVNMRVGPSQEYRIEWVYKREGLPVKVLRVREGWRLVEDHEGTQGWVAASQLSPRLGALVQGDDLADLRAEPSATAALNWRAEPGVVGELMRCRDDYCEIDVAGRSGWILQERLWGVGAMEPSGS